MRPLLRKLFDIREGEGLRALLMFVYIMLLIASLLIVKPVRNSMFLTQFGAEQLPYAFTLVAIFAAIITVIYSKFATRLRLNALILSTTIVIISNLLLFWGFFSYDRTQPWLIYLFYIWVAIYGVISTSQFWLLANYVFNAREARRLFGFVGAGAITGGILGGYLTNILAPLIGTEQLVLVCAAFLAVCMVIIQFVWKKSARDNYRERMHQQKRLQQKQPTQNALLLILQSRHLSYLAGIVLVSVVVANLVDFQYSTIAANIITDEDELTAFFGFWLSNLSVISLLIQLFFTGRILKHFGVGTSLFVLPAGIFIGALTIVFSPVLWAAILVKVSDGAFKQSIHKAGLELISLPIPATIKNQVKAFIDVFVDNFATGLSGVLLIILSVTLQLPVIFIAALCVVLVGVWIFLGLKLKEEYVNSFRLALEKRSIDLEDQTINVNDAAVVETLIPVLKGKNERQILYALSLLENIKNNRFLPYYRHLLQHPSDEIKLRVFELLQNDDVTNEAMELVATGSHEVRIAAMQHICHHATDPVKIFHDALDQENLPIQNAAIVCIARESVENSVLLQKIAFESIIRKIWQRAENKKYPANETIFIKKNIAEVIGYVNMPDLLDLLGKLLDDDNRQVRIAAIKAAGLTNSPQFVDRLVKFLERGSERRAAREALADYGDLIFDKLIAYLNREDIAPAIKLAIPTVLALIGVQRSVDILFEALISANPGLRRQIARSLNQLHANYPLLKFSEKPIRAGILSECEIYTMLLAAYKIHHSEMQNQVHWSNSRRQAARLLEKTLTERMDDSFKRMFRFLTLLKSSSHDFQNAHHAIVNGPADARANATEFLENVLDSELKMFIIPITEHRNLQVLIKRTQVLTDRFNLQKNNYCAALFDMNDSWLKCCTLHWMMESGMAIDAEKVKSAREDPDLKVRQMAGVVCRNVENQ